MTQTYLSSQLQINNPGEIKMKRLLPIVIILILGTTNVFGQYSWDNPREVVLDTYENPIPFLMDGEMCIAYELHITNFGLDSLLIKSIKIFADNDTLPYKIYSGDYLIKSLSRIKVPTSSKNDTIVRPGQRAILYALLSFPEGKLPQKLYHRVEYDILSGNQIKNEVITTGGKISIDQNEKAIVIDSPVQEGIWQISNSVADGYVGHRQGAIRPYNGIPYSRQRYAIDLIRLNGKGEAVQGNFHDNLNWFSYNSDVLAVADAYVVDIHDNDPECPPLMSDDERLAKITSLGGNYIILDLGNSMYAEYAHLKPGSILVKKGDKVRKGQLLAKVGSSGNSTVPHLHFGINRDVPANGQPIPFVFNTYKYLGPSIADELKVEHSKLGKIQKEMLPKVNSIIQLGESDSTNKAASVFLKRQEFLYIMHNKNVNAAAQYFYNLRKMDLNIMLFGEQEMNLIGYNYLENKKYEDAIEIFKLNVIAYPNSGNVYDSLGEAYMKNNNKELAIKNYERSLKLDPTNKNAEEMLKRLRSVK